MKTLAKQVGERIGAADGVIVFDPSAFAKKDLRERGEHDLLAVPSNTLVRDLETEPPVYAGRGRPPARPFMQVRMWCAALPDTAWTCLDVRDGVRKDRW